MPSKAQGEPSLETSAFPSTADAAIDPAMPPGSSGAWSGHPINLRLSVPFLHTRFYLTIVAGRERRPEDRRQQERSAHPVVTFGNALFAIGVSTLITLMGLAALIATSAIIEF